MLTVNHTPLASIVSAPGSAGGPCGRHPCGHTACLELRLTAASACVRCGRRIGYDTKFFDSDAGDRVHVDCRVAKAHPPARPAGWAFVREVR